MPWKMSVGNAQTPDPRNRDINRKNFILSAFFDMRRLIALATCEIPPAMTHQETRQPQWVILSQAFSNCENSGISLFCSPPRPITRQRYVCEGPLRASPL